MTRFKMGQHTAIGFEIIEAPPGRIAEYSPSHAAAIARVDELNNEPPPAPAAPCCDCAAQVGRTKRALLRLVDGIEAIATSLYADHQTVLLRALQETRAIARGEG